MGVERVVEAIQRYHPSPDLVLLREAYEFAAHHHRGQVRASGDPYLTHLEEVSLLVCQLKLDVASVIAALLHDVLEDTEVSREEVVQKFGLQVADIVEGVTKLTRIEFESREERQAENFRKMLLAMAKDIRVILVKLCDRLHNMRTLSFQPEHKQRRIAQETKEIYAPLANRLGIQWLKSELEDLCLLHLRPEMYEQIKEFIEGNAPEREAYVQRTAKDIIKHLDEAGVSASVKGRGKHFSSIFQKMEQSHLGIDEVHDVLGFRVIVPTLRACYEGLGIVHSVYKPVPGRFKDYIAMPKPNMYQSLHTTVIGPEGQRIEIQIRTPEMNRVAEEGIAAHWKYKESGGSVPPGAGASTSFDLQWVKELVESQQYLKNPDEFLQSVKGELYAGEVFVFTPRGDLLRLPFNSTPVDFAYSVHTDVGNHTSGARVNGQIVPLSHKLQNGDTVEVITNKNQNPSKDWLRYVVSSKAKQRVRAFLKAQEHVRALALGQELMSRDLRRVKLSLKKLEREGKLLEVTNALGFKTEGELYAEIGYGKIQVTKVVAKFLPEDRAAAEQLKKPPTPLEKIFEKAAQVSREKVGVRVHGVDDILVRFARCCEPLPGDRIVGFITRGRGVTVHNADCAQVLDCDPQRRIEVGWDGEVKAPRKVRLTVHSQDQIGLLANMTQAITTHGANISSAQIKTTTSGKAVNSFELTISDARQLEKIKRAIEMVPGVIKVERVRHLSTELNVDELTKR